MNRFNLFPKVELHIHFDGSINPSVVSNLIDKDKDLVLKEMIVDNSCKSLNEYLEKFNLPIQVLQTKDNLKLFASYLVKDLIKDNVIYAEIRFAPFKHTLNGLDVIEVIDSVIDGFKNDKIKINLILCMMRGDTKENNLKVIDLAYKYKNKGVGGIDLAGAEAIYKTSDYKELFEYAKLKNVLYTIHAGEASGRESIISAITFDTKRIGHGVRIMEEEDLIDIAKNKNITFEVCPTSNIDTKIFSNYEFHNIKKMYEKGLKVTINTDNRTVSNITLSKEYQKLNNIFSITEEDLKIMNLNAIEASFLNNDDKLYLKKQYMEKYNEYLNNKEGLS